MSILDKFYFFDFGAIGENLAAGEKYAKLAEFALAARRQNPIVFDELTEWVRDNKNWADANLSENERLFMGILARFKEQNAALRVLLRELEPSGVVNAAVFPALDRFDDELSGKLHDKNLQDAVSAVFADFLAMLTREIREVVAGTPTGQFGTLGVEIFGYVNYLKDCDASVQWTLFMPSMVERQQKGFKVETFEYRKLPAMRFIGREGDDLADLENRKALFRTLDALGHKSGFDYDVLFMHHYGLAAENPWHGFWGRFMAADAPVPEGFVHFDFVPERDNDNFVAGPPFLSQFTFATFSGNLDAMHTTEGYDSDAMYDVTRNIMLGQGINIPYPDKYWTTEVFLEGCENPSTAYMFSAEK